MHTRALYNAFGLSNVLTKSSRTCLAWWIVIVVHAEYWVCVVCPPAATGYDSTDHTTSRQKCVLKHIRRICVFRTKCTKIIAVLEFKTRSLWHNVSILLVPWCIAAHSTTILCLAHPCLPLCLVNPEVNMSNTHGASIREREFILRGLSVAVFKSEPFDAREANDALHAMQYCSPCNPFTNESNEKNDRSTVVNETYRKFFFKEIGALLPPEFDVLDLGLSTFHVEMLPSDDESERKAVASFRLYFPPSLFTKVFPWGSPLSVDLPRVTILSADGRPDGVQLSSNLFPKTFKRGAVRATAPPLPFGLQGWGVDYRLPITVSRGGSTSFERFSGAITSDYQCGIRLFHLHMRTSNRLRRSVGGLSEDSDWSSKLKAR